MSVATGDLNNDGDLDLVTANRTSRFGEYGVSVALGNGQGGFGQNWDYYTGGSFTSSVALADFNNDGHLDVTANTNSDNVVVLLNSGRWNSGDYLYHFRPPLTYEVGQYPHDVTTGDFNDDGNDDIATANRLGDNVSVLYNDGMGEDPSFNRSDYPAGSYPNGITAADLDLDGDTDLVSSNIGYDDITVLINDGQKVFSTTSIPSGGLEPNSVTAGDFNNDGKPDIATANTDSDNISLFAGDGQGNFNLTHSYSVQDAPSGITKGDYNGDGLLDVAISNAFSESVSVLSGLRDGQSGLSAADNFAVGHLPSDITTGDFNGDSLPDLLTSNSFSDNASVLLNEPRVPPVAVNDAYNGAQEDQPFVVDAANGVLANDTDANGDDTLTASLETNAGKGSVNLNPNGSFTYTSNKNFNGSDTFTYVANDGTANSEPATVTITVGSVNDSPVALNDTTTVKENISKNINVLANDTDPDGPLQISSVNVVSLPLNGTVTANEDGTITYKPDPNFTGNESFKYEVCDFHGGCDRATVIFAVTPFTEPPVDPNACTIKGTDGNDVLTGTAKRDVICGMGGNDTIRGGLGNDVIRGSSGNDTLYGNDGNDSLYGGSGDDKLVGGAGKDLLSGGAGKDTERQ